MSVNKAILIGNLGRDPELRYTAAQFPICSFSIATSDRRKDQNGTWNDITEWHNIVTLGKTAENCSKYLKKGRQVFIDGKIQTRKWKDKEGRDRYTTEIIANTVQFIGGRAEGGSRQDFGGESDSPRAAAVGDFESLPSADDVSAAANDVSFDDDDIPF